MASAATQISADVCTECDGTGRAAMETSSKGSEMGDCSSCTAACRKCRTQQFKEDLIEGYCAECVAGAVEAIVEVVALPSVTIETVTNEEAVEELQRRAQPAFRGIPGVA